MNRLEIINKVDTTKFIPASKLVHEISSLDHKEITKNLKKFSITCPYDYLRACNNHNFTDLYFNRIDNTLQENSKYIMIKKTKTGKVIYLFIKELDAIYFELINRFKANGLYDVERNRIRGHFIAENVLRFGTKKTNYYYIEFDQADIGKLIKKKHYYTDMSHKEIQAQLCNLGVLFNYEAKVARGEKQKDIYNSEFGKIATVTDFDINSGFMVESARRSIDLIDVLWFGRDPFFEYIAYEVELSRKWADVLTKFANLSLVYRNLGRPITCIIVSYKEYYNAVSQRIKEPCYSYAWKNINLKFLPLDSFLGFLGEIKNQSHLPLEFKDHFFKNILVDLKGYFFS